MGTEPKEEDLLTLGELRPSDGDIEESREGDRPCQQTHEMGYNGEGRNHYREKRTIMVDVEILGGVGLIERCAVVGMPEGALENKEVIAAFGLQFGDGTDNGQHKP